MELPNTKNGLIFRRKRIPSVEEFQKIRAQRQGKFQLFFRSLHIVLATGVNISTGIWRLIQIVC